MFYPKNGTADRQYSTANLADQQQFSKACQFELRRLLFEFGAIVRASAEAIVKFWDAITALLPIKNLTPPDRNLTGGVRNQTYIKDSIQETPLKDPLTSKRDVVFFSDKCNTEAIEVSGCELASAQPLVTSESPVKQDLSAVCDKKNTSDLQIKLAAIGVALQNVEWIIRKIPAVDRDRVVGDAIAWVSEQKWVEQPAAAFVSAVRSRKKSAKVVDKELLQIIDTHKTESQQFSQWYSLAKRRGYVEYSQGDSDHYAIVMTSDLKWLPWRQAQVNLRVLMLTDDELEARA